MTVTGPGVRKVRDAASLRAGVAIAADEMLARIEELEAENARLTRENASLWESVHEAQDAATEHERAREDA